MSKLYNQINQKICSEFNQDYFKLDQEQNKMFKFKSQLKKINKFNPAQGCDSLKLYCIVKQYHIIFHLISKPNFFNLHYDKFQINQKIGRIYTIDLRQHKNNLNKLIEARLQKSPDPQAWITLQFTINNTQYVNKDKGLIQLGKLQYNNMKDVAMQVQKQNDQMVDQNNKLLDQLQKMQKDNLHLSNNISNINHFHKNHGTISQTSSQNKYKDGSEYNQSQIRQKLTKMKQFSSKHDLQEIKNQVYQVFKK